MSFEESVLGAALTDPSVYWRIADLTKPEHFVGASHAALWRSIVAAAAGGEAFDAVTLSETHGSLPLELANGCFSTANVRAYAAKLADAYTSRAVTLAGRRIAALEGSGVDRLEQAAGILRGIQVGTREVKGFREVFAPVYERMQRDCDEQRPIQGLATGWGNLDDLTSGLMPGNLVIVAGRPSMGKSVFAVQLAMNVGLSGVGVHLASLEMTAEECLERMLSAESQVPHASIRQASRIEAHEWPRVTAAGQRLSKAAIGFDDEAYSLDAICARIRQAAMSRGIGLAVIDYLGYMDLPKAERRDLAVQEATRALKRLAKELQIPVVLLCQLNREVGSRANHRPVLTDLRDSGAIEQDADLVILLHREDYYTRGPLDGYAEVIVAKHRNGRLGVCPMRHRFDVMRFDEAEALPNVEERPSGFSKRARGFSGSEARAGTA